MGLFDFFRGTPKGQTVSTLSSSAQKAASTLRSRLELRPLPKERESKDPYGFSNLLRLAEERFSGYPQDSPRRIRRVLRYLAQYDDDVAGALRDLRALVNPGYTFEFVGGKRAADAAEREVLAWEKTVFDGGFATLINNQVREEFVSGASSLEWVPERNRRGIKRVEVVQAENIVIRRDPDTDGWTYAQDYIFAEPIPLHPLTYKYVPVETEGSSPYGIPIAVSALFSLDRKYSLLEAEKRVINLMAHSALVTAAVPLPTPEELGVESRQDPEYPNKLASYYETVADLIMAGTENGLYVGPATSDGKVEITATPLNQTGSGAKDIVQANQHRVWDALGSQPFLRGEMGSTNYALASVVWPMLAAQADNVQLSLAMQLEHGVNLHLRLRGIPAQFYIHFNERTTAFEKDQAEADKIKAETDTLLKKLFGNAWYQHAARRWDVVEEDAEQAPDWWQGGSSEGTSESQIIDEIEGDA